MSVITAAITPHPCGDVYVDPNEKRTTNSIQPDAWFVAELIGVLATPFEHVTDLSSLARGFTPIPAGN